MGLPQFWVHTNMNKNGDVVWGYPWLVGEKLGEGPVVCLCASLD